MWVLEGQPAKAVGHSAQLACPIRIRRVHPQLAEHDLRHPVEQRRPVGYVPVERGRIPAHLVAEPADGQTVDTVTVDDPQRGDFDVVYPWAFSAVTAPRAVAPKPMATARSRRLYVPNDPMISMVCSTEQ
jgi:hypothetical protein